jgi:hypothetical protein
MQLRISFLTNTGADEAIRLWSMTILIKSNTIIGFTCYGSCTKVWRRWVTTPVITLLVTIASITREMETFIKSGNPRSRQLFTDLVDNNKATFSKILPWHFILVGCFSERIQDNELIDFVSLNCRTVNETIKSLERNISSHECERLYRSWTILLAVLHPKFTPENMYMATKWLFLNFLLLKRSSYNLGQNSWDHSSQYYKVIEHWQNKLCPPPSSMLWTTPKQLLVIYHDTSSTLSWGSWGLRMATWFNMEFIIKIRKFSIEGKYSQPVMSKIVAWMSKVWATNYYLASRRYT